MVEHSPTVFPSGVPNLDTLIGGGLRPGDLVLVSGPPGSGKTTLAFQLAFALAASGQTAVCVSTTSEPPARLVAHLRSMRFFDESRIGAGIFLEAAPLQASPVELARRLAGAVQRYGARMLIIDGLAALTDSFESPLAAQTFFGELIGTLAAASCVCVATTPRVPNMRRSVPVEFTSSDGIIELAQEDLAGRTLRSIRIWKMRGAPSALGSHAMFLDSAGVEVSPQLEALPLPQPRQLPDARVSTGTADLDEAMGGGAPSGSVTFVAGGPATGKTLLALRFTVGALARGERAVYVTFREDAEQLLVRGGAITGADLHGAVRDGRLTLIRFAAAHALADQIAGRMLQALDRTRAQVLVLDGVADVDRAIADERRRSAFHAWLAEHLRARGVTSWMTLDRSHRGAFASSEFMDPALDALADNLVMLHGGPASGAGERAVSVVKMRNSAFDPAPRAYAIDGTGLRMHPKAVS